MEKSRMLGEFLVKNKVVTAHHMIIAIEEQKKTARDMSLMIQIEQIHGKTTLETVLARLQEKNETPYDSVRALNLFTDSEIDDLAFDEKAYRIPLGRILVKQNFINEQDMETWIERFDNQVFEDEDLVIKLLHNIPLFSKTDDSHLRSIYPLLKYKQYSSDEIIYRDKEESNYLYFIESGLVRLSVLTGSQHMELGSLQSGDYFGLHGTLSGTPRLERAIAIMNSSVWRLGRDHLISFLKENPDLAIDAAAHISGDMQEIITSVKDKSTRVGASNIHLILFSDDADEDRFSASFATEIFRSCKGDVLLIHSQKNSAWPESSEMNNFDVKNIEPHILFSEPLHNDETQTRKCEIVHWPGIEEKTDLDRLSIWLNEKSPHYETVVFIVGTGSLEFRKLLMGVCRRSVLIVNRHIPGFVEFLKPERDKVFLLRTDSYTGDLERFRELLRINGDALAANVMARDEKTAGVITRWMLGKSVGIALGGGGARGFSHIGLLKVLEAEGFIIDAFAGSSAGCIMSSLAAGGRPAVEMEVFCNKYLARKKHVLSDYTIPLKAPFYAAHE